MRPQQSPEHEPGFLLERPDEISTAIEYLGLLLGARVEDEDLALTLKKDFVAVEKAKTLNTETVWVSQFSGNLVGKLTPKQQRDQPKPHRPGQRI